MGFKIPNFAKQMGGSPFHISYDAAYDAQSDEKKLLKQEKNLKKQLKLTTKKLMELRNLLKRLKAVNCLTLKQKG